MDGDGLILAIYFGTASNARSFIGHRLAIAPQRLVENSTQHVSADLGLNGVCDPSKVLLFCDTVNRCKHPIGRISPSRSEQVRRNRQVATVTINLNWCLFFSKNVHRT
jgi:hypothetical protein